MKATGETVQEKLNVGYIDKFWKDFLDTEPLLTAEEVTKCKSMLEHQTYGNFLKSATMGLYRQEFETVMGTKIENMQGN